MRFRQPPEQNEEQAITRLVDAPATGAQPVQGGGWADRPEIRRQVAAQRHVADQLRRGGPAVPDRLVHSIDAKVRDAYGEGAPRPGRLLAVGSRWRPAIALGGLAAVCAAVVVAVVGVGGSGGPSIPAAAALAFERSTGPAPTVKSARLLDVSYGGVTFPNYAKFSVPPTGERTDRIGGRPALTVYYRLPDGTPLSYTVFSGKAVPLPSNVRNVVFKGVPLREALDHLRPVRGHSGAVRTHVRTRCEDHAEHRPRACRRARARPAQGVTAERQPFTSSRSAICPRPRCRRLMIVPSRVPRARAASR